MALYTIFIILASTILLYLSLYASLFIMIAIASLSKRKLKKITKTKNPKITVVVPVCNEGKIIIDCIRSLQVQDYKNFDIIAILGSKEDTSLPFLKKFFLKRARITQTKFGTLLTKGNLNVLIENEEKGKSKKLNEASKLTNADIIALLDADHKALPNWLSKSIGYFSEESQGEKIGIVQCRRFSLGSENVTSVWDTMQSHIGNEVASRAFTALNLNVFLTGTTALIKKDLVDKLGFGNCITEDTYFSYQTILNNYKIVYCPETGSYEESVHDLRSFLNRKRRWAAGHTSTMFKFFPRIFNLEFNTGAQLFFHSQFFILPLLVLIFIMIYGYHYFIQYPLLFSLITATLATILALVLSIYLGGNAYRILSSFFIALILIVPLLATISVFWLYLTENELYYHILTFPLLLLKPFSYLVIFTLVAPFIPVIAGAFIFRPKHIYKYILSIITFPFLLFFDIYGCVLGLTDLALGKKEWVKTRRVGKVIKEEVSGKFKKSIFTRVEESRDWMWVLIIPLILLFLLINDSLCEDNCGVIECKVFKPFLFPPDSDLGLSFNVDKTESINGIKFNATIPISSNKLFGLLNATIFLDSQELKSFYFTGNTTINTEFYLPFGFNKHVLSIRVKGSRVDCNRENYISDSLVKIKGKKIYLNGEPFLIKCVIPSFFSSKYPLSIREGLMLIKETGANALRLYHEANDDMLIEAKQQGFMVIEQPSRTTWNEVNLASVKGYLLKFRGMASQHEGEPVILLRNLGNEWELFNKPSKVADFLTEISKEIDKDVPLTYSTNYIPLNLSVDVISINMLNEEKEFWDNAVKLMNLGNKPFFASEFGGFGAFFERPSEELRSKRMRTEWDILMENNFSGVCIYESHDNWAQPIPPIQGYNDPTRPEQPDDERGIYTVDNKPKESFYLAQEIFSDFDYELGNVTNNTQLILINKRDYKLSDVNLELENSQHYIGSFAPHEKKEIILPLKIDKPKLKFNYRTHSGLKATSVIYLKNL